MARLFKALASTPRRKILAYLARSSMTAGEIAQRFSMSKPAISNHLNILKEAGLITEEKRGQYVHYALVHENLINELYDFLGEFCPVSETLRQESLKKARQRTV